MSKNTIARNARNARNARASVTQLLASEAARMMTPAAPAGSPANPVVTPSPAPAVTMKPSPAPAGTPDKASALATLTTALKGLVDAAGSFQSAFMAAVRAGATRAELKAAFEAAGVKKNTFNKAIQRGGNECFHLRLRAVRSDAGLTKDEMEVARWAAEYLNDKSVPATPETPAEKVEREAKEAAEKAAKEAAGVKLTPEEIGTAWLRDLTPEGLAAAVKAAKGKNALKFLAATVAVLAPVKAK